MMKKRKYHHNIKYLRVKPRRALEESLQEGDKGTKKKTYEGEKFRGGRKNMCKDPGGGN